MKTFKTILFASLTLAATACGPAGKEFLGVWDYTGTQKIIVEGYTSNEPRKGKYTVVEGTTSDLLITESPCSFPADVEDGSAQVVVGSLCTFTDNYGETWMVQVRSGELAGKKGSAVYSYAWDITRSAQGKSATFSVTGTEQLSKIGK